jgi:putative hydrolase of the HAD superfamily
METVTKCILFDLDGTLFDRDSAVRELVTSQYERFSEALATVPVDAYVDRVLALDAHGYTDKVDVYQRALSELGLAAALANVLVGDFWAAYHRLTRPFPDACSVLSELRTHGLKLGIITNGSVAIQEPVIVRHGFAPLMDVILISERERTWKPEPEIFVRALRGLDTRADEAWFVGDNPDSDIRGAAAAGLTAVWRRTPYWPKPTAPHRTIDQLQELVPLVLSSL